MSVRGHIISYLESEPYTQKYKKAHGNSASLERLWYYRYMYVWPYQFDFMLLEQKWLANEIGRSVLK